MRFGRLLFFSFTLVAGCGDYPRDIDGTLRNVRSKQVVRVGLMANSGDPLQRGLVAAFLDRVRTATGAVPRIVIGPAEPLLVQLDQQRLDLVIGEIATDSPWATEVAIIEPLAEHRLGSRTIGLSPIARNGENQWIALLETQARDFKAGR